MTRLLRGFKATRILLMLSFVFIAFGGIWSYLYSHRYSPLLIEEVANPPLITRNALSVYVNDARIKAKLKPLKIDAALNISAQNKCLDMVKKDYWAHNDPAGNTPWHFISEQEKFMRAGENLEYGYTYSKPVVSAWMNSKGHRENILNPKFTSEGFGICKSDSYINQGPRVIVVQHFVGSL